MSDPLEAVADFTPAKVKVRGTRTGDTVSFECTFQRNTDGVLSALDLSGSTLRGQLRKGNGDLVAEATIDMTDAVDGEVIVSFDLTGVPGGTTDPTEYRWGLRDDTGARTLVADKWFVNQAEVRD